MVRGEAREVGPPRDVGHAYVQAARGCERDVVPAREERGGKERFDDVRDDLARRVVKLCPTRRWR